MVENLNLKEESAYGINSSIGAGISSDADLFAIPEVVEETVK